MGKMTRTQLLTASRVRGLHVGGNKPGSKIGRRRMESLILMSTISVVYYRISYEWKSTNKPHQKRDSEEKTK